MRPITGTAKVIRRRVSNAVLDGLRPMEEFTRRLITASAIGDSSYNHRNAGKLWSAIPQANRNPLPPSMDKAQFLAQNHLSPGPDEDSLEFDLIKDTLRPGSFVELRRNRIVTHGIILQLQVMEARMHCLTLTYTGEVWPHLINDISYIIPGFVSEDLLERAGNGYETQSTAQTTARLQVVEQIRVFTRQHERHFNALAKGIQPLYDRLRHRDPDRWAYVTTPEATALLDTPKPPPVISLFAVHAQLMHLPLYYVADPRNHRTSHRFSVRPLSHVQTILQVNEWTRSRDPVFQSFVQNARNIITKHREVQETHRNGPPLLFESNFPSWSSSDLKFINYLKNSLRNMRAIQEDPYDLALPTIIKSIDMHREHVVGPGLAQLLLIELGVITPWEDVVTRMPELHLDIAPPDQSREVQAVDELVQHSLSNPDTPVPPIIKRKLGNLRLTGSTELHPRDPYEAQRHDFKDMPVYVVDDKDAQELDDGISIEGVPGQPGSYWLHIHVADPTTAIPPGHVFDLRAKEAALTFYSYHRTWPMLPTSLTKPLFSLGLASQEDGQPVLTLSVKMSETGEFLDYNVRMGLVRNLNILTYEQVDDFLGIENNYRSKPFSRAKPSTSSGRPVPETFRSDLRKIHNLAQRYYLRTLDTGNIVNFSFSRAVVRFPDKLPTRPFLPARPVLWKGYPSMEYVIEDSEEICGSFRQSVAECMKLAGRVASRFCRDNGVPALRRACRPLRAETPGDIEELLSLRRPNGHVDVEECLKRNVYAPPGEPTLTLRGHWGLGIPDGEGYTRVSSPLRRYNDLLMHWQIKHALMPGTNRPLFSDDYLKPLSFSLFEKEKLMASAESTYHKNWALTYLDRYIQEERLKHGPKYDPFPNLMCRIIGAIRFDTMHATGQAAVLIPSLGVQGELRGLSVQKPIPIGSNVAVKIEGFRMGIPSSLQLTLA